MEKRLSSANMQIGTRLCRSSEKAPFFCGASNGLKHVTYPGHRSRCNAFRCPPSINGRVAGHFSLSLSICTPADPDRRWRRLQRAIQLCVRATTGYHYDLINKFFDSGFAAIDPRRFLLPFLQQLFSACLSLPILRSDCLLSRHFAVSFYLRKSDYVSFFATI